MNVYTRMQMRDSRGKRVGRCKEWVKVVGDSEVDVRVLAMRHKDKGHIPPERHATKPERVLAYRFRPMLSMQVAVRCPRVCCNCHTVTIISLSLISFAWLGVIQLWI